MTLSEKLQGAIDELIAAMPVGVPYDIEIMLNAADVTSSEFRGNRVTEAYWVRKGHAQIAATIDV